MNKALLSVAPRVRSQTAPQLPSPEVARDNLLQTVREYFQAGTRVLILEGDDGAGKTTLCRQLIETQPRVFSLFVHAATRWGYDPEYLCHDLCAQISLYLDGKELEPSSQGAGQALAALYHRLGRLAARDSQPCLFVVDGLHELPSSDEHIQQRILDFLPLGLPGHQILVTDTVKHKVAFRHPNDAKSWRLPGFSFDEARQILATFGLQDATVRQLNLVAHGRPGHLTSIRRLLAGGTTAEAILSEAPTLLGDLYQMEWTIVSSADQRHKLLLALVAFEHQGRQLSELAPLAGWSVADAQQWLSTLSFIRLSSDSQQADFYSLPFREFVKEKLAAQKREAESIIIDDLLKRKDSMEAFEALPRYFKDAGRLQDLIAYLSPERFSDTLLHSESLAPIREGAAIGLRASLDLERDGDALRFAIQHSTLSDAHASSTWKAEVEALIALGDYGAALGLAQSTVVKEERLHLLAAVVKGQRLRGFAPEPLVLQEIQTLHAAVGPLLTSQKAQEIAEDLFFADPDAAFALLQQATKKDGGNLGVDWALASLAIRATHQSRTGSTPEAVEQLRQKISDSDLRQFSAAVSLLHRDVPASELLQQAESVSRAANRLFLMRSWTSRNRRRPDAIRVTAAALSLSIATTEYTPNASDVLQWAFPLMFSTDQEEVLSLVARFDGQLGTVEKLGPTVEAIRLRLCLAVALMNCARPEARERFVAIFLDVCQVPDLSVRSECLARFVGALAEWDKAQQLEERESLHTVSEAELERAVQELLANTAEHLEVLRGTLQALCPYRVDLAVKFINCINVPSRRDHARRVAIRASTGLAVTDVPWAAVCHLLDAIEDADVRDPLLVGIVERYYSHEGIESVDKRWIVQLVDRLMRIRSASQRARGCAFMLGMFRRVVAGVDADIAARVRQELVRAWGAIDAMWDRAGVAFEIAETCAEVDVGLAREYLERGRQAKAEAVGGMSAASWIYTVPLRLAISAFGGLMRHRADTDDDFKRLTELIKRVPSADERCVLAGELALRYHFNERAEECKRTVAEVLRPELAALKTADYGAYVNCVFGVAGALYVAHVATAVREIQELPGPDRDFAIGQVVRVLLERVVPSEPYEEVAGGKYELNYEQATEVLDLAQSADADYLIASCCRAVSGAACRPGAMTAQQRSDVAKRIAEIADKKLPQRGSVSHDGYPIVVHAYALRVKKGTKQEWQALIDRAKRVSNAADASFVLASIAEILPSTIAGREQVFEEAIRRTEGVPATYDRLCRLTQFSSDEFSMKEDVTKELLIKAMDLSKTCAYGDVYPIQRRIIDYGYRIDPSYAATLCERLDDDPARWRSRVADARLGLKDRIETLNARKDLEKAPLPESELVKKREALAEAAWMQLGALNAGRVTARRLEDIRGYLDIAAKMPLSEAYPILAWAIGNISRRYVSEPDVRRLLRPMFDATALVCQIASVMSLRTPALPKASAGSEGSVPVPAGARTLALSTIATWLEEADGVLRICDPYFGPADLEVLKLVLERKPETRVKVLTSLKHLREIRLTDPISEAFRHYWRVHVSDQEPPWTEIVVAGLEGTGQLPVHDRWIIASNGGLRVGTSFSSLGMRRDSEISVLAAADVPGIAGMVDAFLERTVRQREGVRMTYEVFSL